MNRFFLILTVILLSGTVMSARYYDNENPVADPAAVVVCGNARFSVLTPELIRMEWNENGNFEDNKTLTFVNRNLPVPRFSKSVSKSGATIKTDALTLKYRNNGKPFDASNLEIVFKLNGKNVKWVPGMEDKGNLLGTTRTLDKVNGYNFRKGSKMEPGLLSRDGWVVVDDSSNHLMVSDSTHWEQWVKVRGNEKKQDLYFFGYGHNYKKALTDYQKVAGKAVLPPKYTFGYWWSRYWQYSDDEFQQIVDRLKSYDIPIDVLIVDMDWHDTFGLRQKDSPLDEVGQRIGWTGYTWQKELFPSPSNFLEWTNRENLKTALNLHPASGIQPYEKCYDAFVKDYGWDKKGEPVPFHIDESKWADSYFNVVLSPMEKMGVDFWWLDWQQWLESKFTKGLSNTFWLNHTFFHHARENESHEGANQRPFIYHRWGGLGSHRYPLGFSGDTYTSWETLAFLPWFTSTASNVNYGYWGHDIGGHMFPSGVKTTDPELYLRWLQYGVFTPIYKTHSTKNNNIIRYPWAFPDHQFMMRDAIQLRYALAPYIYNAARENYDTGIGMCRPMYYEYPDLDKAYNVPEQFFFGPDIIATAIASPADSTTGLAPRKMWFPEGEWYDYATGNVYKGNNEYDLEYTLDENPFFIKGGAIIPMNADNVRSLQVPCDTLVFAFVPGSEGTLRYYEDDGLTDQYIDSYAITNVERKLSGNNIHVKIGKRNGSYSNAPVKRAYELRFPATMPPKKVIVDGKEYSYARFATPGTWTYSGLSLQPVVYTEMLPVGSDVEIVLEYGDVDPYQEKLRGKKGLFKRFRTLTPEFKEEQSNNGDGKRMLPEGYLKASQCANFITEDPNNIDKYIDNFDAAIRDLPEVMNTDQYSSPAFKHRVLQQTAKRD